MQARCADNPRSAHAMALAARLCLLGLTLLLGAAPAPAGAQERPAADKRIALVVGNAQYPKVPLANPENDARLVAANLRKLGFEVNLQLNVSVLQFRRALREFARRVQQDDAAAVLYYAGHGVQIDGRNYLLPVDIDLRDQEEVKDESVDIEELFLSRIDKAGSHPRIVILDACRDNPFAAKTRNIRSAGGLAEMGARGTLIAFASAPGAQAEDGPSGRNSVYTRYLAEEMMIPGLEVEQMFKNVRVKVLRETRERQLPWVNTSLTSDFSFNPAARRPAAESAVASASPPPAPGPPAAPGGRDARPKDIDSLLSQAERARPAEVAAAPPSAPQAAAPRPAPPALPAPPSPPAAPLPPVAALTPAPPVPAAAATGVPSRKFLERDELQQLLVGKTHTLRDTAGGSVTRWDLRSGGLVYYNSQGSGGTALNASGRWELKDDGTLCARFNPLPPSRLSDARSPDNGCWHYFRDGEKLLRTDAGPGAAAQAEVLRIQ